MSSFQKLPNIGKTLSDKLETIGVKSENDLQELGSKNALIKISKLENSGACINMLYALEGAIQGIRWHNLDKDTKHNLKEFYNFNFS